jgi:uncharacterized protein YdcH (DUF465 family)
MPNLDQSLKQELLETDQEFRRLHQEHQSFEARLEELRQKSVWSEEDELEEKQIKRQKLFLKDRMEAILRSYRESSVSV